MLHALLVAATILSSGGIADRSCDHAPAVIAGDSEKHCTCDDCGKGCKKCEHCAKKCDCAQCEKDGDHCEGGKKTAACDCEKKK